MKLILLTLAALFSLVIMIPTVHAQVTTSSNYEPNDCRVCVPDWIKNNAGWWADGIIDNSSFISGIEWLVSNDIIHVPSTAVSDAAESSIPDWVKNTAGWWAGDIISDDDFVNSIQYLIKVGIMTVPQGEKVVPETTSMPTDADPKLIREADELKSKIDACQQKDTEADIYLCSSKFEKQLATIELMMEASKFEAGPVNFYYKPALVEISPYGNSFVEIILVMRNTDTEIQSLFCTGPEACNITFTDGKKSWKYAANDIPTGRLAMVPDTIYTIKISYGPPPQKQYDRWHYDSSSEYFLKINESYGNVSIPLELTVK